MDKCTLKRLCNICKESHLTILHDVNATKSATVMLTSSPSELLHIDKPNRSYKVMLKVVNICIHNGEQMLMQSLMMVQIDVSCSPKLSRRNRRNTCYQRSIHCRESWAVRTHTHPVKQLQEQYHHPRGIPLQSIDHVCPLVLIGSDYAHLITATEPILMGPPGGPLAVHTRIGWALQGPASLIQTQHTFSFTLTCLKSKLLRNVERLWQIDTLAYMNEKRVTRSKHDKIALDLLHSKTTRVNTVGVMRYATPLLRAPNTPVLKAPKEAVMSHPCATEKHLVKDLKLSDKYQEEMDNLVQSGYIQRIPSEQLDQSKEIWYFPHQTVEHNNKYRVVFDCSFEYMGQSLNKCLLPGPTLGPSLLGALLRFCQHPVAICGDIKGMFHQVRLLNEDKPLLRFIWRGMQLNQEPSVYEWQVLPFGTTCSPCCATYAVHKHVQDHCDGNEEVLQSVQQSFLC